MMMPVSVTSLAPLVSSQIQLVPKTGSEAQSLTQSLTEADEELVRLFCNFIGLHLQGEYNRFGIRRQIIHRKRKQSSIEEEQAWEEFLFGKERDNEQDTPKGLQFLMDNLSQGSIADCFLIASLYGVLKNPGFGKKWLARMIEPVTDIKNQNLYQVTFPGHCKHSLIINPTDLNRKHQVKGGLGFLILERAFGLLSQKLALTIPNQAGHLDSVISNINGGGYPAVALQALTGCPTQVLQEQAPEQTAENFSDLFSQFITTIRQKPDIYVVTVTTGGREGYADSEGRFPAWHVYTLQVCKRSGQLLVVNPWDTANKRYPVTPEELKTYFCAFSLSMAPQKNNDLPLAS